MSKVLACTHCEKWIEIDRDAEFNYGPNETGPYCDRCWMMYKEIIHLGERVDELEKQAKTSRWHPKRHSPYDASRRRT